MALWLFWTFSDFERRSSDILVVCWAMGLSVMLGLEWAVRVRNHRPRQSALFFVGLMAAGLGCFLLWGRWWWMMHGLAGVVALSVLLIRPSYRLETNQSSWWEPLLGHPERLFVGTFAGLVLVGTVLLALPQSFTSGHSIGFLDAAFTSTSAVCVTGLGVLNTSDFSGFGQVVILLMIQVGGLGIMTFSTTALWALGKRVSLRYEGAVARLISTQDRGRLFSTAKMILGFTLVTEVIGAVFLTVLFYEHGDSLREALWRGFFTSISAFCNAGFALQKDSLIAYQHAPSILHIVGLLIVLGGLSPMAVFALPALLRIRKAPVSAQAKLSLAATGILLVLGFFFILAFEWHNALDGLTIAERLQNAWFQSITLRTAGFNSIDMVALQPPTLTLMMLWMFIGGSPGGTAGGVKTTTVSLLVLSVVRAVQGRRTIEAFKKSIPERTRAKAAVIVVVTAVTAVTALVAMQLTQQMSTRLATFEVISALGTVGLSIGGTTTLDGIGKVIIIVCMFVGRVGGVTLLMFLSDRRRETIIERPEEEIDVG
jgi:trk system potassium uptake protein TrkH